MNKTKSFIINFDKFIKESSPNQFKVVFEEKAFIFTRQEVIRVLDYVRAYLYKGQH